jgi:hypothetical protein
MPLCFPSLNTREQYSLSLSLSAPEFGSNKEEDRKTSCTITTPVQEPDSEFRRVAATKIRRSSPNSLLDRKRRITLSIVHCFPLHFSHSSCAFFGSRRKLQKSLTTNEKNSKGRKESVPKSQAQTGSIKCSLGRGLSDSLFLQILILVCSSLCFWNICHQADDGEDDDQNPMSATKFLLFFWHEISESDLEIFHSEFGKSVNRFSKFSTPKELCWRTEKKERKRERKFSLNCWKAKKKKDVSSSLNAGNLFKFKSVTLNFVFVT